MKHAFPKLEALDPTMEITWWHDSLTEAHGHLVDSCYSERFWLPVVGPSAMWLARRFVAEIGEKIDMVDLARSIGLQANVSANSPMTKAVYRLIHFGFARRAGDLLDVRTCVDHVPAGLLARLPESLRLEAQLARNETKKAKVAR